MKRWNVPCDCLFTSVSLSAGLHKSFWTDFHETWMEDVSRPKIDPINFWIHMKRCRGSSGGVQQGPVPPWLWVWTPLWPPDRESASVINWQISYNDFVLKEKCLSSLLPNQNCWNCKYCFKSHLSLVWMRDLSFFSWNVFAPPQKKRPQPGPPIKTGLEPPLMGRIQELFLLVFNAKTCSVFLNVS